MLPWKRDHVGRRIRRDKVSLPHLGVTPKSRGTLASHLIHFAPETILKFPLKPETSP